jgi:hypothetical protein
VTPSIYDRLADLADERGWRLELCMFAGLLRLLVRDDAGTSLTRPVRFDARQRDASALSLIHRLRDLNHLSEA